MAYTGSSIVDYLKSEGKDSSFAARKKLASQLGISGYKGTASQNTTMLNMLKKGAQTASGAESSVSNAQNSAAVSAETEKKPEYSPSLTLTQLGQQLADKEALGKQEYVSSYQQQIEELLAKALEREQFSYDYQADPLYRQYESAYVRNGRKAMEETMANAAALTGGYGSSYAVTAGNEAYQSYLAELQNIIPALYESAYGRYQDAYRDILDELGLLNDLDAGEYEKYRDEVADYYADLNYYYQQYNDLSEKEYQQYLTDLEQWGKDRDYYYQKQQDEQAQKNWEAEFALTQQKNSKSSSGGSSSKKRKTDASTDKITAQEPLSKQAQNVLQTALTMRDAGKQNEYVDMEKKKGRITSEEATRIIRQL